MRILESIKSFHDVFITSTQNHNNLLPRCTILDYRRHSNYRILGTTPSTDRRVASCLQIGKLVLTFDNEGTTHRPALQM